MKNKKLLFLLLVVAAGAIVLAFYGWSSVRKANVTQDHLADMEMAGISLDLPFFQETSKRLEKRMGEIEKQVYESIGKPFNINSTQQLSDVLFKQLGLEPPDRGNKTASGHFSTSAGVLISLDTASCARPTPSSTTPRQGRGIGAR